MVGTAITGSAIPQAIDDPIFDLIDTHRKAVAEVATAEAESNRLYELVDRTVGGCMVVIPDKRRSYPTGPRDHYLPVAYQKDGIDYVEASTMPDIDHHLPFAANEELRSHYKKQLDAIRVAHQRIWDGKAMDDAFSRLCTAESEAMHALVETAPTTIRLLALLAAWSRAG